MKTTATIGALLTSFTVLAAPRPLSAVPKKLAVLEFHNYTGISEHEAMFLTDLVRGAAVLALPEEGYLVMTRESIFELLPPGKTLTDCVGECEVETGRNIGADYIVSGELIRFGASLRLSLKLFETQTSRLIGTQTVKAGAVEELEAPIRTASNTLFRKIGGRAVEGDRSPSGADPGSGPTFVAPATQGAGPGESKLVEIKPTERPKAKSGPAGIYITTEPKGAEVLIGDVKVGDTDPAFQRADLRPGDTVRVTLEKEEYHPVRFDVTLRPGIARYEGIELKPAFGALEILSEPAGARVTLGGAEVGVTPYTRERVPSGRHLVSLSLDLHEGVNDEILEVKDGERASRTFRLDPNFGTLEVASSPSGAMVRIDGTERGVTPLELRLPPGAYEVVVGKSGYHGRSYEITLARSQGVAISADQGFFIQSKQATDQFIHFIGTVSDLANRTINIEPGLQLIGTTYPVEVTLEDAGFFEDGAHGALNEANADRIWMWDKSKNPEWYRYAWLFDSGGAYPGYDGTWYETELGGETTMTLKPGFGYWYQNKGAVFTWTYPNPK